MTASWVVKTAIELQRAGHLLVEDGNHGEYRPRREEFNRTGVAFIRAANMRNGRVLFERASRINQVALARIRKGIGRPGDTLLSHKGTVGKVAWAPLDAPPFVCSPQTTFWRAMPRGELEGRYLTYYLLSRDFQAQLDAYKGETSMADYVSLTSQRLLKVVVPPLTEQRRIAAVLGALDDKRETNRRLKQSLELVARALFRTWFVEFEGHDDLVESDAGLIPRGWELGTIGSAIRLLYGRSLPKGSRLPGVVPVYGSGGIAGTHSEPLVDGPGVIVGRKGSVGTVYWEARPFYPIDTVFYVEAPSEAWLNWSYELLRSLDIERLAADSAVPGVNRNAILSQACIIPPDARVQEFWRVTGVIRARIRSLAEESQVLTELRDTLLPKLLSGELRAPEAMALVKGIL